VYNCLGLGLEIMTFTKECIHETLPNFFKKKGKEKETRGKDQSLFIIYNMFVWDQKVH
jgi:hypothetical protein